MPTCNRLARCCPVGDQAPPQFSADGSYWWDGEQWLPVDQLPKPVQVSPRLEFPTLPDRRGGRRFLAVVPLAGALIAVVAVVGTLAATGWLPIAGARPGPTSSPSAPHPTVSATPSPTASPAPGRTPALMAGVSLQSILAVARRQGVACLNVAPDVPGVVEFCQVTKHRILRRIVVYGATDKSIRMVRAMYRDDGAHPDSAAAASFLSAVAGFPYPGADAAQATAWIGAHVTAPSASTTIGSMRLKSRLEVKGHRFVVDILPA
jgi:hypothetical protein